MLGIGCGRLRGGGEHLGWLHGFWPEPPEALGSKVGKIWETHQRLYKGSFNLGWVKLN